MTQPGIKPGLLGDCLYFEIVKLIKQIKSNHILTYARFLESCDIRHVAIHLLQLSIR